MLFSTIYKSDFLINQFGIGVCLGFVNMNFRKTGSNVINWISDFEFGFLERNCIIIF